MVHVDRGGDAFLYVGVVASVHRANVYSQGIIEYFKRFSESKQVRNPSSLRRSVNRRDLLNAHDGGSSTLIPPEAST